MEGTNVSKIGIMIAISAKIPISVTLCFFTMQRHIAELLGQMRSSCTGWCLLSREKAVKDVRSCVRFRYLVGVYLDLDWSRKK